MSFKKIIFIKCILFLNISLAYAEFEVVEKNANVIESSKAYTINQNVMIAAPGIMALKLLATAGGTLSGSLI